MTTLLRSNHVGDIVQELQNRKFTSPFWGRDDVVYTPEVIVNCFSDSPVSARVVVTETVPGDAAVYSMTWHLAKVGLEDLVDAVELVFPGYRAPEEVMKYARK